jgi:hypothetical protein
LIADILTGVAGRHVLVRGPHNLFVDAMATQATLALSQRLVGLGSDDKQRESRGQNRHRERFQHKHPPSGIVVDVSKLGMMTLVGHSNFVAEWNCWFNPGFSVRPI